MGAAPVCTCIVISETCTVAAATAQIFMNMVRTEVFDDSETFFFAQNRVQGFYENIAQSQMAVVVQATWNDLTICQNRQLMPQAMAGAVGTVIRCVFIRPFKKLVKIHIGMGCNGVAVNLAHIGVNGLGQMIGLLKGFENKLVAKALVSFGSTIRFQSRKLI